MMASASPYRLQIHLSDEMRRALRTVAAREDTSIQALVTRVLHAYLRTQPEGAQLPPLPAEDD